MVGLAMILNLALVVVGAECWWNGRSGYDIKSCSGGGGSRVLVEW